MIIIIIMAYHSRFPSSRSKRRGNISFGMGYNAPPKGPGKRGHIIADTNVSPFARANNICCRHKYCVRDTKNVSDFVQKHFVSATNVSQFAQHGNTTFILSPARLHAQERS